MATNLIRFISKLGSLRRARWATAIIGLVALGVSAAPIHAQTTVGYVGMHNCHLTVNFLQDPDGQRMYREGWLPTGQQLAAVSGWPPGPPGTASLSLWIFDCQQVALNGATLGPVMLSLAGVQIQDRVYAALPTHWDNYLVFAQTNNDRLTQALRAAGLPASVVRGMAFNWRGDGTTTTVNVPWADSPYLVSIRGQVDDIPHTHDNTFQHGATPGAGPALHLIVDPLVPRDKFCAPTPDPGCTTIVTRPGSAMARFLGSATSTLAADHELIPFAQLQVDN